MYCCGIGLVTHSSNGDIAVALFIWDKAKLSTINFSKNSNLEDSEIFLPFSPF